LLIGCGVVLVPAAAVALLVARNWSTLSGVYHSATTALSELMAVQKVVESRYGGLVKVMSKHQSGVSEPILSITLVNPSLLDRLDPGGPAGKQAALEIAACGRDALPPSSAYENYEVVLMRQRGVGLTFGQNWVFRFRARDLPAVAPAGAGGSK
jgi:hypothetical protein